MFVCFPIKNYLFETTCMSQWGQILNTPLQCTCEIGHGFRWRQNPFWDFATGSHSWGLFGVAKRPPYLLHCWIFFASGSVCTGLMLCPCSSQLLERLDTAPRAQPMVVSWKKPSLRPPVLEWVWMLNHDPDVWGASSTSELLARYNLKYLFNILFTSHLRITLLYLV